MPTGTNRTEVWTTGRKWAGNLMPFLCWLPFAIAGIMEIAHARAVTPKGLALLAIATLVGWIGLSLFGFWGNASMRRVLDARIKDKGERIFVGFASPKFSGLLDAHEDVGFLVFGPDKLTFAGDSLWVELPKDAIARVRFRPNIHTVVGLGRWISIEGVVKGQPVRMFVEPRERSTMLGNLLRSKALKQKIETWTKPLA